VDKDLDGWEVCLSYHDGFANDWRVQSYPWAGNSEVALDIEMAISMAPGLSKVIVYEGANWHNILNRMAMDNLAKQLSCSWYMPGAGADAVADQIWQQMAAQGQSFYNASGDSVFPGYTLKVLTGKDAAGKDVWAKLADGHRTTEKKLTITLTKLTDGSSSTMRIYPGTSSTPFGPDAFKQTIDLQDGENPLGIFVRGKVGNSWQYVDFVRLTVNSGESTDWELVDVQVKQIGVSVNQDYDWKYEGDGRGGITGIWTTRTSTGTATARMVGTWDIPDRLTPGTQVNVSGTVTSELDFKSGAADWCSGGMYQLGPEDGGLDAFAMNEAAAQPDIGRAAVPADQVQKLFFTMIGCDTGSGTMSAEKTATGTLTVPDRLAVTGDQVPYLVVGFVLDQDYDTVQVSYIYR
jgi:hypothetical protein